MSEPERQKSGLRERKKARTRATIQRHALQLFREQGYEATTVRQIAEAAEISEGTFFRYFATKEEVIHWDDFDALLVEAVRAQPAGAQPIAALRGAFRAILFPLSPEERAELRDRVVLMLSIPPAHASTLADDQFLLGPMKRLVDAVAERVGRHPDDFAVRTLVGAVLGVAMSVMFAVAADPEADLVCMLDEAMGMLEHGLPV